jgi:hypothetical protein
VNAKDALLVAAAIVGVCAALYVVVACIGAYVVVRINRRIERDSREMDARRARIQAEVDLGSRVTTRRRPL